MSEVDTSPDLLLDVNALHFPNRANEAIAFAAAEIRALEAERDELRAQLSQAHNAALEEAANCCRPSDFNDPDEIRVWEYVKHKITALKHTQETSE